ncbi:MAG: hypothetical protein QOG26_1625 [Solirubrobacterales bacterium]|jgi:hypothetical protein|nr:hypothetical protein [Solirubrobacterales bacterium]
MSRTKHYLRGVVVVVLVAPPIAILNHRNDWDPWLLFFATFAGGMLATIVTCIGYPFEPSARHPDADEREPASGRASSPTRSA